MKYTNINSELMKKINFKFVLDTIRQKEPISRKELAEEIGLTSSSITNIVNRLNEEGYLIESGSGESAGGRRPIMLELNPNARYAVGVELTVANITCIITDLKAKKIHKKVCRTELQNGREKVVQKMLGIINQTIEESKVPREKILGIGFVSAGPYDHKKGVMVNPPNFPGWYKVPIRDIIQNAIGIPAFFEKETVGAAIAESWFGKRGKAGSIFAITVGNIGIGGGAIIDGQVYHGFCDGAGDIGHMVIDIEGPACTCGNYGCLETVASGMAIVRNLRSAIKRGEACSLANSVADIDDITVDMVIKASREGDVLCTRMVEKSARYLGVAISNLINVYSPELIIIGGEIPELCPYYSEVAIEFVKKRSYPLYNKDVMILPATFGEEQGAMGGIGLVFQEFFKNVDN